ncbi:MAG: sodium/glutamate symporter [Fusobacterium sp. JB019]|nr:sodium/glutamate symporter [Fusobacterium sp. JB020]MDP0505908.1 sodium/glutamate symporter [Fusobacterium sp. JB019]
MPILYYLSFISLLTLLGIFIKSKSHFLNKFFIPSSIIGGLIGLILGPEILGRFYEIVPFEWYHNIKSIPSVLIIPLTASIPIGLKLKGSKKNNNSSINMTLILFMVTFLQLLVGFLVNHFYTIFNPSAIYESFGSELNAGFAGGHGIAGIMGLILKDLHLKYWNLAQGVAASMATFGLVFGILFGIVLINIEKRRVKVYSKNEIEIINGNISEKEETYKSSNQNKNLRSNKLVVYFALVFFACGVAFVLSNLFRKYDIFILSNISSWSLAMIIMFVLWKYVKNYSISEGVDLELRNMVSGLLIEYAVVSAVATLPLRAVFTYITPILITATLGIFSTWFFINILCKRYFKDNFRFQRSITMFGTSTGIFITGLLLLRVCDPELKTPVLKDYSLGFSIVAILGPIFNLIFYSTKLRVEYNSIAPILLLIFMIILGFSILEYFNHNKIKN